jgi:hypothetical protein
MCPLNQPKKTDDPVVTKVRDAIAHRGLWMGLILREAKERGLDWEAIGRQAIFNTGCMHGDGIMERMDIPDSLVSFGNTFFTEDIRKIFEIEVKKLDENDLQLEYGHCPLVAAWKQIGVDDETLAKLCDIAMSGDRGIASRFSKFEFELGKTIAEGHPVCEVKFSRKK